MDLCDYGYADLCDCGYVTLCDCEYVDLCDCGYVVLRGYVGPCECKYVCPCDCGYVALCDCGYVGPYVWSVAIPCGRGRQLRCRSCGRRGRSGMFWCHYRAAEIWEVGSRENLELLVGMEDEPQVWVDVKADFSVVEVVVVVEAFVDVDVDEDDEE